MHKSLVSLTLLILIETSGVPGAWAQLSSIANSWPGIAQQTGGSLRPPDPHGAAGPNGVLQIVNVRVQYWNKSGTSVWGPVPFVTFFPATAGSFAFDPRAVYDAASGRFFVLALEAKDSTQQSFLNIAVSKTSNPTTSGPSDWYIYHIENTRTVSGNKYWGDYPGLGFDSQAIYVTVNLYGFVSGASDAQITVLDKAALISGTTNYNFVYTTGGQMGGFTLQPCTVAATNSPANVAYFGETFPGGSSSQVRIWALSDPLGARNLTSARVTIPDNGGSPLGEAPQPGTTYTIDPLDGRTQGNAFWNNGAVWFCHTAGGSSGRTMVYYYKVNVAGFPGASPTLAESGKIDGGSGMWTYQPSIGGNAAGAVCLVYCESSTTTFPTIMYTTRVGAAASFDTPTIVKASPGYANTDRWGDYGSVSVDPTDQSFWVTHEWAHSTARHDWGTWWANVLLTEAPRITAQPQPATNTVLQGMPASFAVTAAGTDPLRYQWRFNGMNLAGASASVLSLGAAQVSNAGAYSVVITNPYGSVTSSNAYLAVIPTVPLPFALNNSNVVWTTNAQTPWYGQTTVSHDGIAAAQSYFIGNGQQTDLRTTVAGPATLSFWWKISSQTNADIGTFLYGATEVARISGEVDWQYRQVYLPTGSVNLQWTYAKDTNVMAGADALWVDQVSVSNGATAPFIVTQPADQISIGGAPVRFAVEASGTPPLGYQWRFNGADIPGGTASTYVIASPRSSDNGVYSVLVSSPFGSVLSSNAIVGVLPLAIQGDNSLGQLNASLGATNPVIIALGGWHALAADAQGRVVAWGDNYDGQCNVPASLSNVVALAGGGFHSLALSADGTVSAWGANDSGQATPPADLSNVTAIAAGAYHSLALRADGTVVGWGDNSLSQVSVPAGLTDAVAIAAGGNHSLALRADGSVVAWGDNSDALGLYAGQSDVPDGLGQVMAIGAGDYHSLAILADGSVACWGDNTYGQSQPPVGLGEVIALAGGGAHTVALKADHSVVAWGADWSGQCDFAASLTNVLAVAAGNSHSLVMLGSLSQGGPQLVAPRRAAGVFSAAIASQPGRYYRLEYISSATDTNWVSLPLFPGNGSVLRFTDPAASGPQRYYRLRQY